MSKQAKKKIYVKAYTYGHTIDGEHNTAVAFKQCSMAWCTYFSSSSFPSSMGVGMEYNARMKGVLKCIVNIMLTNGSYSSIHFHSQKDFISGHRSVEQCTWQQKKKNEHNEQVPRPFRFLHILDKLINALKEYTKIIIFEHFWKKISSIFITNASNFTAQTIRIPSKSHCVCEIFYKIAI